MREVLYNAFPACPSEIRRYGIRKKAFFKGDPRHIEVDMISAMTHIEQNPPFSGFDHGRMDAAGFIQNAEILTVQKMAHDVSGFQQFEYLHQWNRRMRDMNHYREAAGFRCRLFCKPKRLYTVGPDDLGLLTHFDSHNTFGMSRSRVGRTLRIV